MIANLDSVFRAAECGAVGSFNILDLDMAAGIIETSEIARRPVVVGVATRHFEAIHTTCLAPGLRKLAEESRFPVALHLDHATPRDRHLISEALDLGFTSIMFDASAFPLEMNARLSAEVVEECSGYGASVEGEVGGIGGSEGVADTHGAEIRVLPYTDAADAANYVRSSGIHALAIAVGTAHGIYKATPEISFDTIERVRNSVSVPLVLHGSTGVKPEDIRSCVAHGIRKINFFSGLLVAAMDRIRGDGPMLGYDLLELKRRIGTDWRNLVREQIELYAAR